MSLENTFTAFYLVNFYVTVVNVRHVPLHNKYEHMTNIN